MKLFISPDIHQELITYGEGSPSLEVCGALLGHKTSEDEWTCDEFIPMTNISAENPEVHYIPEPQELFAVLDKTTHMHKDAKKDLVGIFHTHPNSLPIASVTDLYGAGYQGFYLIYSPRFKQMGHYYYEGYEPRFKEAEVTITEV